MDVETEQAKEAVVKGSQGWVGPAFAGLDLEEPDADVDRKAKRTKMLGVVVGTEFGERYALARTNVFGDSGRGVSGVVCFGGDNGGIPYP
jgi:hypothetical protein